MPTNRVKNDAKMEDVLFRPKHRKHLSMLHGQTNFHCIQHLDKKRKLISETKDSREHYT